MHFLQTGSDLGSRLTPSANWRQGHTSFLALSRDTRDPDRELLGLEEVQSQQWVGHSRGWSWVLGAVNSTLGPLPLDAGSSPSTVTTGVPRRCLVFPGGRTPPDVTPILVQ